VLVSDVAVNERIADCAITVIARDGLDALSIRRVATEAGVAIGTVQYHYPTRADLVLAALKRTAHRQHVRATGARRRPTVVATLVARLALLLPHDDPSREEAFAWVALAAAAARDPLVGPDQHRIVSGTVEAINALLDRARQAGELPATVDTLDLAERIHVVVEGYLLQTAATGGTATPRVQRQLRATLTTLMTSARDGNGAPPITSPSD
jgi:AcrR family transcriptional regulator